MGGHARSVVDTIEDLMEYEIAGFIDKQSEISYREYQVLGNDDTLGQLYKKGVTNAFVTVGYMGKTDVRSRIYEKLKKIGFTLPVIADRRSVIAKDAVIGEGTYIGKNAVVNSNASIGRMCIINTASIVEHDCVIDDFTHIAVGAVICGGCKIGKEDLIGANATIIQQQVVGNHVIVGAGCTVRHNIMSNTVYVGK